MPIVTSGLFGSFLSEQSHNSPDELAVVFQDWRWNYRELSRHVDDCAKGLIAADVGVGDRVALLAGPRPEFMVVYLACARIGAILVGLNPVQQLDEYRHILADSRPAMFFAFRNARGRDNEAIIETLASEIDFSSPPIMLDNWSEGQSDYAKFVTRGLKVSSAELGDRSSALTPGDEVLIVYTSGTTGRPKGAVLTQDNIAFSAALYCRIWPLSPLRVICDLPITHVQVG